MYNAITSYTHTHTFTHECTNEYAHVFNTGLVVGPALLDVVPYVDSFRLLGKMGIMLLVTESGFSVDIRTVKKVSTHTQ